MARRPISASRTIALLFIFLNLVVFADAFLGRKKKQQKEAELAALRAAEEAARQECMVTIGGKEYEKVVVYGLTAAIAVFLSLGLVFQLFRKREQTGGESGPREASSQNDQQEKKAHGALSGMKFTYRWCFATALINVFVIKRQDWQEPFTWITACDMFRTLNLLMFGHGLWTVTEMYRKSLASGATMTNDDARVLCLTMARIWLTTAWSLLGVSTSLAASMGQRAKDAEGSRAGAISTFGAPAGVLAIASLGSLAFQWLFAEVIEEIEAKRAPLKPDAERTRLAGFRASRNMALCMGSYALLATVQFINWVLKPSSLAGRLFSVFDFITPSTICGLLVPLYKSTLKTVIAVTEGRRDFPTGKFHLYDDLYSAQKEFYSKVGSTLKSAMIFTLLPYLFASITQALAHWLGPCFHQN